MKATVTKKVEVEIKSILIEVQPRHIGISEDDDLSPDAPMLSGNNWKAEVDVDTGQIKGWPQGRTLDIFIKVCDAGFYTLKDQDGEIVATKDGYVPNNIVPGEYGDYISLKVNEDGVVTNWPSQPSVDEFFENEED